MPSDRSGEPWTGATYNGFSGPNAAEPVRPAPAQPAATAPSAGVSKRNLMIGGLAGAVALGLVFGLWARTPGKDPLSSKAEAATPASVPIEVAQPAPMTLPQNTGPLEVLSPDQVQAARASAPVVVASTSRAEPQPQVIEGRDVAAVAPQVEEPPAYAPPRRAPLRQGAINCGAPASAVEQSICEDAGLVPSERRPSRAERRAMRDGYGEGAYRAPPPRYQTEDEPAEDDPGDATN